MFAAARSFVELLKTNIEYFPRTVGMSKVTLDKRYSGSLLGIGWAVVKPTLFVCVYWFAVSVGIRGGKPMGEIPFILWLTSGIMPWFFVSDALTIGGSSIRHNSHLVTKMVYPVATIPVSEVLSLFYVHLLMMGFVTSIFILSGYGLTIYFTQIIYYLFCTLSFAIVVATLLSALTAVSRDIEHMVRSTIQVLFWLTPIIWNVDRLEGLIKNVILLNPITYLVQGYRNAFVLERWFFVQWEYTTYFWVFMITLTLLTSFLFSRLQREFADVL